MTITGIFIGLIVFVVIGVFHPLIIYSEYHFGKRIWPVFLFSGILLCIISLFISNIIFNATLGITAFCCFWSIKELFQQQKRVEWGWFPKK
jgi:hypothetical protein